MKLMSASASAYTSAEAANTSPMQAALDMVNAPTQALLNRPLIGNGANGLAGTGRDDGPAGLLVGNGGNGGTGGFGDDFHNQGGGGLGGGHGVLFGRTGRTGV